MQRYNRFSKKLKRANRYLKYFWNIGFVSHLFLFQVKFCVETTDKEDKPVKIDPKITTKPNVVNQPLRTQTFSQNHPALSNELPNELLSKQHVNVLPPLPTQKNLSFPPAMNQNYNSQRGLQQNIFPQSVVSYPNMQYPQFSPWKPEERQTNNPPPSWWSNINQNQNYPQDNFQQYSNNIPYLNSNEPFSNMDFASKAQNAGYSPWRQQRPFPGPGPSVPYENQSQNLSMRQVMLKEAVNMPNFGNPNPVRPSTVRKHTDKTSLVYSVQINVHQLIINQFWSIKLAENNVPRC